MAVAITDDRLLDETARRPARHEPKLPTRHAPERHAPKRPAPAAPERHAPAAPDPRAHCAPNGSEPTDRPAPPWPAPERLQSVVAALDRLAGAVPGDAAVLAAICDPRSSRSDLMLRDQGGQVTLVAGLNGRHRRMLESLIELADGASSPASRPWGAGADPQDRQLDRAAAADMLVEGSPVALLLVDSSGMIETASPAACEQLALEAPSELLGRRLGELVCEADREALARVWRSLRGGERLEAAITLRMLRRDGSTVRLELRLRSIGPDAGCGAGWLAVALAQPPRPRTVSAEELATARRQRSLADSADCGTALFELRDGQVGVLLEANQTFGRIVGVDSEQLIGCAPEAILDATDAPRLREALVALVRTGQPQRLAARLSGGPAARLAEIYARLDHSSGDPPTLLSLRVRDITEQRSAGAELAAEVERLQRSNRELAELARVAAHDLAAPLRALTGLVDLLDPGARRSGDEQTLLAVQSAIGRMQEMVDGMLGYAQSSQSAAEVRREPVDLEQVLQFALEGLEREITASGALITATELPVVLGDPNLLERLLRNLLENAIKYAGEGRPRIALSAAPSAEGWLVSVADEGIGVREEDRERVFELFERGGSKASAAAGRGIGLAVCRRIVELHGGQIRACANRPQGTVFSFTLPGEPTRAPGSEPPSARATQQSSVEHGPAHHASPPAPLGPLACA